MEEVKYMNELEHQWIFYVLCMIDHNRNLI